MLGNVHEDVFRARSRYTYLKPCLVPDCAIIECSGGGEEEHDGDKGVQHHREDQRNQVEQGDVHEEHCNVHFRGA